MNISRYIFLLILIISSGLSFSQSYHNLKIEIDSLGEKFHNIPRENLIIKIENLKSRMESVSPNDSIWIHYSNIVNKICALRELNRLGLKITDQISEINIIKNDSLYYPNIFIKYSIFYYALGLLDSSKIYNDKAISIAEKYNQNSVLTDAYMRKGTISQREKNHYEAISNFLIADSLCEIIDDNEYRGAILYNIANSYYEQLDYKNALRYFKKSASQLITTNNYLYEQAFQAIGIVYVTMDSLEMAEKAFIKMDSFLTLKDAPNQKILNLITIQELQYKLGKYKESIKNYKKIKSLSQNSRDSNFPLSVGLAISCYLELNDTNSAKTLYENNKNILAHKSEYLNLVSLLSIQLQKQNIEYRKGLDRLIEIKDSINNSSIEGKAAELNEKYQAEKKEAQIQKLKQEQIIKDIELKNHRLMIFISLIVLALLGLLSHIFYTKSKQRKQLNEELKEKYEELKYYNTELIQKIEQSPDENFLEQYLTISDRQKTKIKLENILFIESKNKAIFIHTVDGQTYKDWHQSLKGYLNILPKNIFTQVNRATIVNKTHIISKQNGNINLKGNVDVLFSPKYNI